MTRLERQRIEERLSIIFQLIEFFGGEGENDGSRDLGYGNVSYDNDDNNCTGLF